MAATQFTTWASKGHDWLDPTEYHWAVRGFFYDAAEISGFVPGFHIDFAVSAPGFEFNIEPPSCKFVINADARMEID